MVQLIKRQKVKNCHRYGHYILYEFFLQRKGDRMSIRAHSNMAKYRAKCSKIRQYMTTMVLLLSIKILLLISLIFVVLFPFLLMFFILFNWTYLITKSSTQLQNASDRRWKTFKVELVRMLAFD